jgi:hypothetical protein
MDKKMFKDDSLYKANNNLSLQDKKMVLDYNKQLKKEERARNKKETVPKEKKERKKRTNKPKSNPKPKRNLYDDNIFYGIASRIPNLGIPNNIIHNTIYEPEEVANPLNKDFYNNFKDEDPN